MLLNTKELLEVAYKNQFGIGAYNIGNSEFVKAVIDVAEEKQSPAILQIHPLEIDLMTDGMAAYVREASSKTKMPISIHLDHGGSVDDCLRAIRNGFTSVMIDASHLPYEENIAMTKEVVDLAHKVGVSVEAELGTIGSNAHSGEEGAEKTLYTDPKQARDFVERTGVDFLAVAIGTVHGIYPKDLEPEIQLDRLEAIQKNIPIPMVLHGGSDNPDEKIIATTKRGISKINLSSDMKIAFYKTFKETMIERPNDYEPWLITKEATEAARAVLRKKMDIFGSRGKASLYK